MVLKIYPQFNIIITKADEYQMIRWILDEWMSIKWTEEGQMNR